MPLCVAFSTYNGINISDLGSGLDGLCKPANPVPVVQSPEQDCPHASTSSPSRYPSSYFANASDTSEAAHSHGRTLYSYWNAVGNEPVTAETISALLSNSLPNLGVKDFLSRQECVRMVDVIRTHAIGSYGINVYPPIGKVGITQFDNQNGKQTYFASVPSARNLQQRFIQEAKIDILAREGIQEYFAGLLRPINSSALVHANYGPFDAPGWEIGRIYAQLSWNILLREGRKER
ncbi:hypothetical protein GQ44DRAFT_761508 [Phaeosphaeriaceae sp. PMI808]|nr:hypothetical protein GQ44DRAFT_761508 [Phaeosphaeriaceae sp. PMI808]